MARGPGRRAKFLLPLGKSRDARDPNLSYPPVTVVAMVHRTAVNPLADAVDMTDAELRDLGEALHELLEADPTDFSAVRRLLADWALTVRLRRHPDFAENAAAFREALESDEG